MFTKVIKNIVVLFTLMLFMLGCATASKTVDNADIDNSKSKQEELRKVFIKWKLHGVVYLSKILIPDEVPVFVKFPYRSVNPINNRICVLLFADERKYVGIVMMFGVDKCKHLAMIVGRVENNKTVGEQCYVFINGIPSPVTPEELMDFVEKNIEKGLSYD